MERLTYDFAIGGKHCWEVHGADNLLCSEVCKNQGDKGCEDCPLRKAIDRLAAYEDINLTPEEIMILCRMDRRAKIAELLRMEENKPLTLEQVMEMHSEPVWVVLEQDECVPIHQWAIVDCSLETASGLGFCLHFEDYGAWRAYRYMDGFDMSIKLGHGKSRPGEIMRSLNQPP